MRFIVYGAGGVGGVVGARLAQHGHDVVLIARGAHYEAIRAGGLRIESPDAVVTVRLPVFNRPDQLSFAKSDFVLLAMKSQDTLHAVDTPRQTHVQAGANRSDDLAETLDDAALAGFDLGQAGPDRVPKRARNHKQKE